MNQLLCNGNATIMQVQLAVELYVTVVELYKNFLSILYFNLVCYFFLTMLIH